MKRMLIIAGIILGAALVIGCAGGPDTTPAEIMDPTFKIVDHKNAALGAEIPDWVTMDVGELEDEFDDEYVFRFEQTGQDLDGVRIIADNMNAPAEVAALVSTRVAAIFAGAQVGDEDFIETYFERIVETLAEAEINGLRKYGDFWVLKEWYDRRGRPAEREYEYYSLYRISEAQVDDLIERAIAGLDAVTEEEITARDRVKEILDGGL